MAEVECVVTNPQHTSRYERIKAELIRRLSLFKEHRVRQLLMHEKMGDLRPTQFLRTLAGLSVTSEFLRTLWTNRLPPNIQAIIATQAQVSLDDVAKVADNVAQVTPHPGMAHVSSSGDDICTLTVRIYEPARQAAAISTSPSRPRSPSQKRRIARRSSCPAGRSPGPDICWHHRLEERAKLCAAPYM